MRFTSRAELAAHTEEITRLGSEAGLSSPVFRSAYARWRMYRHEHFGLAAAYRGAWRRLRRLVLGEEPTCRVCGEPSTNVDHILPVALGSPRARSDLQALCQRCHSDKTAREVPRLMESSWSIDPTFAPIPSDLVNPHSPLFAAAVAATRPRAMLNGRRSLR